MKLNVVLVIVDCLRYDYAEKMPFLRQLGQEIPGGWWFSNHWSTSHCTDPSIMHMISGKHPDELRLYSMMFDDKKYVAPDVSTFFHTAADRGYESMFITNVQRWYNRGVDHFEDSRGKGIDWPWNNAIKSVQLLKSPFLLVLHTDDCHTRYTGGTYPEACVYTDRRLKQLYSACPKNTVFMVTADHGEGLGQAGPDGHEIAQHGYGLWDFITHVPLIMSYKWQGKQASAQKVNWLSDNGYIYEVIRALLQDTPMPQPRSLVFQAGATPKVFHRGVVDECGNQFVRATYQDGSHERYARPDLDLVWALELELRDHCLKCGVDYGKVHEDAALIERLKGLGYWDDDVPSH